jgi:L,D-transpeptidase catalytic domain
MMPLLPFKPWLSLVFTTALVCVSCAPQPTYPGSTRSYYGLVLPDGVKRAPGRVANFTRSQFGRLRNPVSGLTQRQPDDGSFWNGDGVPGPARIQIILSQQRAYFFKGGQLVGGSPICSGSPQFPTPTGEFRISEKDADHLSSVYGDYIDSYGNILQTQIDNRKDPKPPGGIFDGAKMNWFMRIKGGVGMHEGYLPGYADSHGCIRLPARMAYTFFNNTPLGTPVRISRE